MNAPIYGIAGVILVAVIVLLFIYDRQTRKVEKW